ncbi:MAG: hypothetical protein QW197_01315 [Candidatus Aenigmatarchaeota archaeon]
MEIELIFFIFGILFLFLILALSFISEIKFESENNTEIKDLFVFKVEITKIKTNVSYVEKTNSSYIPLGFEFHSDVLSFGEIPINSPIERVRRVITLNNLDENVAKVKIFCKGNICNFLNISSNNFFLLSKEKKDVEISAENKNVKGNFEGYIYINVFKPKHKFLEVFVWLL